jgi:hypothetical protein
MTDQASARQGSTGEVEELHESHGHSLASWALVGTELVGTFVICLAIVLKNIPLAVIGGVVCVIGLIAGRLLQMAGFGVHPPSHPDA